MFRGRSFEHRFSRKALAFFTAALITSNAAAETLNAPPAREPPPDTFLAPSAPPPAPPQPFALPELPEKTSGIAFGRVAAQPTTAEQLLAVVAPGSDQGNFNAFYSRLGKDGRPSGPWLTTGDGRGRFDVCAGDLFGDGVNDGIDEYVQTTIRGRQPASVRVLQWDGTTLVELAQLTESLKPEATVTGSSPRASAFALGCTLADMDSDGDLDVVVAYSAGRAVEPAILHAPCISTVLIFWNDDRKLTAHHAALHSTDPNMCISVGDVEVADLNSDGLLDLIVSIHGVYALINPGKDNVWQQHLLRLNTVALSTTQRAYAFGLDVMFQSKSYGATDKVGSEADMYVATAYSSGNWIATGGTTAGAQSDYVGPRVLKCRRGNQALWDSKDCTPIWPSGSGPLEYFNKCQEILPISDGHAVLLGDFTGTGAIEVIATQWMQRVDDKKGKMKDVHTNPLSIVYGAFTIDKPAECPASIAGVSNAANATLRGQGMAVVPTRLVAESVDLKRGKYSLFLLPPETVFVDSVWISSAPCKDTSQDTSQNKLQFAHAVGSQWLTVKELPPETAGELLCVTYRKPDRSNNELESLLYVMAWDLQRDYVIKLQE